MQWFYVGSRVRREAAHVENDMQERRGEEGETGRKLISELCGLYASGWCSMLVLSYTRGTW